MTGRSARDDIGMGRVELFQTHLAALKAGARKYSEEVEREAFDEILLQIDQENDPEIKEFMVKTLKAFCEEDVCLSVRYETSWDHLVKERREHQRAVEPVDLFLALESIIANEYVNYYPKGARELRCHLTIPGIGNEKPRSVRNFDAGEPKASLYESRYEFGSHHLHVGRAVVEMMRHLEKRYGLDLRKLERARQPARDGSTS